MNIIVWIVFGGLAGWIATILTGSDAQFGVLGNVVIGIIGSFLGGWLSTRIFGGPPIKGFDIRNFIIAVLGSVVLLFILHLLF
ncbi:MAG: GlsB/YeaQ/YmgE family stress response membrane protein [Candidatus Doudnabacteria bacterium]|nr:GlsB/YeaQ/YmgE family stress response membrane protein [Candidatus Doudnabacteria bacterium]